ncbi:MAG: alanine racemase [Clostridiales bacterium]|nr:alanine racemase [Clostridiales bacterium]
MISYDEATSRCWAEVDLSVLMHNYRSALGHLKPPTQLICVLKADAYGLGAPRVAKRLWEAGQRMFAVASFNEAAEVRRAVPDADVLILGLCSEAQLHLAIRQGMLLTVFSEDYAKTVIRVAGQVGTKARAHIKLETGLHRLGMMPPEAANAIMRIRDSGQVAIEGLFTHLALRDAASDRAQIELLTACRDTLLQRGMRIPMVHALDSIGMVRYPADHLDAVRTGAWLYGVCPKRYEHPEESQLALTVKTRIAQLHHVPAGECLGYDETHPIHRDSVIATLSAGYIDGYPRLNSKGEVEVCGKRAPVVGLVCMDQMMIDVTDIPEAREGDVVTLLGGSIGVDDLAAWGQLNRNEALARTGKRVPRIYLEDGQVVDIIDTLA